MSLATRVFALPALILFVILLAAADRSELLAQVPVLRLLFAVGAVLLGVGAVVQLAADARTVANEDPLLLAAEILRPPVRGDAAERAIEGSSATLTVDVVAAFRILKSGELADVTTRWIGVRELPTWGSIRHRVQPGEDVVLICSARGAAHDRLAELLAAF